MDKNKKRMEGLKKILELSYPNSMNHEHEKAAALICVLFDVSQRSELLELVTEIANNNQVYSNTRHKLWSKKLIRSNCG